MNWKDAKTETPVDPNSDCLVEFDVDGQKYYRAPVSLHIDPPRKPEWVDEWGHDLNVTRFIELPKI